MSCASAKPTWAASAPTTSIRVAAGDACRGLEQLARQSLAVVVLLDGEGHLGGSQTVGGGVGDVRGAADDRLIGPRPDRHDQAEQPDEIDLVDAVERSLGELLA